MSRSLLLYKWDLDRFITRVKIGYWSDVGNQRAFLDDMAKKLNLTDHERHNITSQMVLQHGGFQLLKKYDYSLSKLLTTLYPEYKQMCRTFVMHAIHDLNLKKVEDLVNVPLEYPYRPS